MIINYFGDKKSETIIYSILCDPTKYKPGMNSKDDILHFNLKYKNRQWARFGLLVIVCLLQLLQL